jgi:hypothetical protein
LLYPTELRALRLLPSSRTRAIPWPGRTPPDALYPACAAVPILQYDLAAKDSTQPPERPGPPTRLWRKQPSPAAFVLIDADNISPQIAAGLFAAIGKLGEASVRRIYGDFSGTRLKFWAETLAAYAIIPHQAFANTPARTPPTLPW